MLFVVKVYNVVCDAQQQPGCMDATDDFTPLPAQSAHAARIVREAALAAGWVRTPDGRDLCPHCQEFQ